jgi:hypothetical protein
MVYTADYVLRSWLRSTRLAMPSVPGHCLRSSLALQCVHGRSRSKVLITLYGAGPTQLQLLVTLYAAGEHFLRSKDCCASCAAGRSPHVWSQSTP